MKWNVETNDFLYDSKKNIIRVDNPPEFLLGEPDYDEVIHLAFPIPLNKFILVNCCKFNELSNFIFEKDGITITLEINGKYHYNDVEIFWLNELQQIWRSIKKSELNIDLTDIVNHIKKKTVSVFFLYPYLFFISSSA